MIQQHPTFGHRRLRGVAAISGLIVNRKRSYRVLKQGWFVHQRVLPPSSCTGLGQSDPVAVTNGGPWM